MKLYYIADSDGLLLDWDWHSHNWVWGHTGFAFKNLIVAERVFWNLDHDLYAQLFLGQSFIGRDDGMVMVHATDHPLFRLARTA